MHEIIEKNLDGIIDLAKRYHCRQLAVFGSAVTGEFDGETSDVDFLVVLEPMEQLGPFDQYFDFKFALEVLLGRHVDLVEVGTVKNTYVADSINESKVTIYGPKTERVPA